MDASKTDMNTVSRRTRNQWDIFYLNRHNEEKGNAGGSGGKNLKKQGIVKNGDATGRGDKFEKDWSSGLRAVSRNMKGFTSSEKSKSVDGVTSRLRSKTVFCAGSQNISEEVVSNGFSSKVERASNYGSVSKLGSVDTVASCSVNAVENTSLIIDVGKDNLEPGSRRSRIGPLNEGSYDTGSIHLEKFKDSADSGLKKNESDTSDFPIIMSESSSEEDSSDEDYEEIESLSSDDSDFECSHSDFGETKNDGYDMDDDDNNSLRKIIVDRNKESVSISGGRMRTFHCGTKSMRMTGKKEDGVLLAEHGENDDTDIKPKPNPKQMEDTIIIIDDEDELPSDGVSPRMNKKRDHGLTELDGASELCADYSLMDGCKKHGDMSDTSSAIRLSKHEDDLTAASDLKRRRNSGADVLVGCDERKITGYDCVAKRLRSHWTYMFPNEKFDNGKLSHPVSVSESEESLSLYSKSGTMKVKGKKAIERNHATVKTFKPTKKVIRKKRNCKIIKMLEDSIDAFREHLFNPEKSIPTHVNLPLKFRFEDEIQPPPERSEWEKEIDSLFCDLEMGLRECEIGCTKSSAPDHDDIVSPVLDMSPAACCQRGEHHHVLDEQIGIRCKYCEIVLLDIRYVLPPFYTHPSGAKDRKEFGESKRFTEVELEHLSRGTPDSTIQTTSGTVWDLMPGVEKELYPHQREGFEFIWRNLAGDVDIEKVKMSISDGGKGCIISHAPGTGKTRLTVAFLLTFMKLYPTCRPLIVAPCSVLLTWEDEFLKWPVDVRFVNMNTNELSGKENDIVTNILGTVGAGEISIEHIRLAKICSWMKSGGILGISYRLFEQLAGDNVRGRQNGHLRTQLLESPGILVLDEGHIARSNESLIFQALKEVATQRRIMLSGTPFQNNFDELFNTLRLVCPGFANNFEYDGSKHTSRKRRDEAKSNWMKLTNSLSGNADDKLKKVRDMIDPFVHLYKGSILQESLPGLRTTLVFLLPSELQNTLLKTATLETNIFLRIQMVSLISVHPCLVAGYEKLSVDKDDLEDIKSNLDAGVKTKFVINLVSLADALGERVLVFSQFIDPLVFIKDKIKSQFSWNEGKQVLYMDGKSDVKHRQYSISSFNDLSSDAKVLFASQKACSEGINLVGASRVVLIDTVWNPSVERQAISRAFRLGQKRFVYVYRLITSGTEFMLYTQQAEKTRLSHLLFSPTDESTRRSKTPSTVSNDKVLDALMNLDNFGHRFGKIVHQPNDSDLPEIFEEMDMV